ncbi:hypothetical protein [Paraburkholderia kirstenboschensis]|uniref:Uncharacterized protein n=1 Tax=Paraburkholderia kirstenboschensis TaxID=1245436 RepID=A0ABZ0EQ32_9BURK|nr:hypothetical protein [Paraburkholderia kirstenboschensis]WOD19309.1 hypothetical protein RW095_23975 [Paraburkholderia kirstenboschensis]
MSITEEKRAYAAMRKPFSVLPLSFCFVDCVSIFVVGIAVSVRVNNETSSIAAAKQC